MLHRIPHLSRFRRCAAVLTVAVAPAATSAQTVDRGTLAITRQGDTLGIEQFTVSRTAAGLDIVTTASYPRRRPRVVIEGTLRLAGGTATSYAGIENTVGGARRVLAQFGPDRVVFRRFSSRGESAHEFPPSVHPLVVFDSVFGFFAVEPARTGAITVATPQRDAFAPASVTDHGIEGTMLRAGRTDLHHLTIDEAAGRPSIHLWYRDGRLLKVEFVASGLKAERIPAPRR